MDTAGRVLVTGAAGQIGSELVPALRERYGPDSVVASDIREDVPRALAGAGPWLRLDVLDRAGIEAALRKNGVRTVFHMAAILSATGERNPLLCWDVNMNGTLNLLEACRASGVERVIVPSSIAVFGPETPREGTPQETVLRPRTMYGITKVAGELISDYYSRSMDLDVRGLRYPGIVSAETLPGGGTT
ncbi:NAD-dependent epimerase/dehydratase family protein, partial [Candidatus Fermentibacterales bacterium]|nr:NAD-dependent epimerase/dehydratase family protein [Candidatus Fermentibacterales bacterium]